MKPRINENENENCYEKTLLFSFWPIKRTYACNKYKLNITIEVTIILIVYIIYLPKRTANLVPIFVDGFL